ncbi:hypothetical protein V8B55DRAFT_1592602 [Mucor lusitanicus]|uniref:Uncharacterized protein n=2 Tax=Mucor circinelloides f. lusitanicus TaxID=29924 RepID=A0A162QIE9_MUCCL|nr:hypothetical protein FB192DRAFT_1442057 [Mucor lusitanicus]OAD02300.1 hypothetical protein MUCCIDRAFT_111670 [Mucor lusitanicus CBS 277.49]
MLLRSGFEYIFSASSSSSSSTTSTRSSRKRKSGEDALDERPLKRQYATLNLLGDLSDASPLSPPVAPPSPSSNPLPSLPSSPETPFVREDSCASDATVPDDDASSEGTVALEDEPAGNERGPRRVHFGSNVIEYLFEADDEPRRVVELRHFARLCDEHIGTACFIDSRIYLATNDTDNLVFIWQVKNEKKTANFSLLECLKTHSSVVITTAASRTYNILVTVSENKTAIIWDLNRKLYVKTLGGHKNGVKIIKINNINPYHLCMNRQWPPIPHQASLS